MPRARTEVLVIGVGSHVVGIDAKTGFELWRTKLKNSSYVTVSRTGDRVHAGAGGELFCLDARTGELLWHNKLKGLGLGIVAFANDFASVLAAQQAAAAAATAATI
ncbi:MAG TPA: PQQ-binding-like beta-propeller repeat protein [Gemmatimonadaceae bacterium]|nr:PQQ-binding-like beta-propeller repeat protein [Gemmatimonadaceae bacterium]